MGWRAFVTACVAAAAAAAGFFAWLVFDLGGTEATRAVADLGLTAAPAVAGFACVVRARHSSGRDRRAWYLLGASAFSWSAGMVIWSYYELVAGRAVPFPSLADAGYLLAIPFAAAGVMSFFNGDWTSRARLVLDGVIVGGSTLFLAWAIHLDTLYRSSQGLPLADQAISLSYPIGDVMIMTLVVLVASYQSKARLRFLLIGGALLWIALADSAYAYLTAKGDYATGDLTDVGWFVGYLVLALAALKPGSDAASSDAGPAHHPLVALPYVLLLACCGLVLVRALDGRALDGFLLWNGVFNVVVLITRQILAIRENRTLTRDLEDKVATRTAELQSSEARLTTMIQNVSDVISVVSPVGGQFRYVSASARDVLGYDPSDLWGRSIFGLAHPGDASVLEPLLTDAGVVGGRAARVEMRMRCRDGSWRHTEVSGADLAEDPTLGGIVLTIRDVTERKGLEEQLRHQAFHDSLTELPNRALFSDRLEHAIVRAGRHGNELAVLFVDLDEFKSVNDSLGHQAGDELLAAMGRRFTDAVRDADTVARIGGDEFAVLAEDTGLDGVVALAERMLEALREPVTLESGETVVSASIGIAVTRGSDTPAAELMRNADIAMYRAKALGKARYQVFEASMHSRVVERVAMGAELRHAIERGELMVHYQPAVLLSTREVRGFEALLRWQRPERGMVSPLDFIGIAEQTGLIVAIGEWVLREACSQLVEWRASSSDLDRIVMSVNVSSVQLADDGFVQMVARVLEETRVPPDRLLLELTESALLEETTTVIGRLAALRALGVRIALDDFGTGYSSLGYLRELPVDCLKVDASFVHAIGADGSGAELAQAVIDLAHSLDLISVAEGVEESHQAEVLTSAGCKAAQGYHFAKPMPADDVPAFLATHKTASLA